MLLTSALLICPMPSAEEEEVPDEEEQRFQADPFLVELARGLQCCFAGIPHAKELERQQNFLHSAQMARKLHIALPSNGLNMHLSLCSTNLLPEQNEVHFLSEFLFNGLPIRLKGQMNMQSLTGNAQVEHLSPLNAISRRQQSQAAGNGSRADNEPTDNNNRDGQQRRERLQRRLAQLREAALRL